jgi:hypothetical protein
MVETNKASGAKGGGSISAKRKCSLDDYDMTTTLGTGKKIQAKLTVSCD